MLCSTEEEEGEGELDLWMGGRGGGVVCTFV